jgi:hypothetical protein
MRAFGIDCGSSGVRAKVNKRGTDIHEIAEVEA